MSIKEDFKHINDMLGFVDDGIKMAKDTLYDKLERDYSGLNTKIIDRLKIPNTNEIKKFTEFDIDKILINIAPNKDESQIQILKDIYDSLEDEEKSKYTDFTEYKRSVFLIIKKEILDIADLEKNKEEIIKEANEISEDYFKYINSDEYKSKRQDRINKMREDAETTESLTEKRKINNMLTGIEKSESLDFLFDRIEKLGTKEIQNTKNIFFDSNRSRLVMEKFTAKLPRYGYNKEIYKMFFNLEEKFLPEEFHPFNNVFLFHVTRTIGYMDTNNDIHNLYTSSILQKMYNLIYHRFSTNEEEKKFIEIIKKFDTYFFDYLDYFNENNITAPKHPSRVLQNKKHEERRRLMLITAIQNAGMMDVDTNLETEELENILRNLTTPHPEVHEVDITSDNIEITPSIPSTKNIEVIINHIKENSKFIGNPITADNKEEITKLFSEETTNLINDIYEIYQDKYGDYYGKFKDSNVYIFFDKDGNILDDNISETTVLQLRNVGELDKTSITLNINLEC